MVPFCNNCLNNFAKVQFLLEKELVFGFKNMEKGKKKVEKYVLRNKKTIKCLWIKI